MDKYLADYRPLAGGKFKADLKVSNDLGWKPEIGHLMVFTVQDDSHALVVLIPPTMSGIFLYQGPKLPSLPGGQGRRARLCGLM
jgi:hypothetical protein